MQFAREGLQRHSIQRYTDRAVWIGGEEHHGSLAVAPGEILADWRCASIDALDATTLAPLHALHPEVLVIATGATVAFPDAAALHPLMRSGVGVEVMNDGAAIRTFNVLLSEERNVVLALVRP